jgi:hypothetical protein
MSYPDEEDDETGADSEALEEREFPDEADMDDSDLNDSDLDDSEETETVACPNCRRMIYEQAERCPYCGQFVTPGHAATRPAMWIVLGAIAALVGLLAYAVL